jgi:predicted transcriptional regulator
LPTSRLPLEVKAFLMENIDSVAHLEVLLMLLNHPARTFTAEEVSKELRSNNHSASNQLRKLCDLKLLKNTNDKFFQYGPSTPELDQKVKELYEVYTQMPVAVITSIYDKPQDKLKDFADAFKLKKD